MFYSLFSQGNFDLKDLLGIIGVMGPGSYTGIRMTDGILQMLKWAGLPVYSFYHFEVPSLLGDLSSSFVCRAFKGELFVYSNGESSLVKEEFWVQQSGIKTYTHYHDEKLVGSFVYTSDLISQFSQLLFSKIVSEKMNREAYYFRPIEKEFKVTCEN